MKIQNRFWKRAIFLMAPFIFIACEKPTGELGRTQVGLDTAGVAKAVFPVITYTAPLDSQVVALAYNDQFLIGGYIGNKLLGAFNDPYFGVAKAGIVTQLALSELNNDFGENPRIDSVKLYLEYAGSYGDTSIPQTIEVFQLANTLSREQLYYSSFEPELGRKLGEKTLTPKPNTPDVIAGQRVRPLLDVTLDSTYFYNEIVSQGDGDYEPLSSTNEFFDFFKGMYIRSANTDGAILYHNLASQSSGVVIYYHNDEDTLDYSLNFAQDEAVVPITFSVFDHDFSQARFDIDNQVDTNQGEERFYVQAMSGTAGILKIPGLDTLAGKNILINGAFMNIYKAKGTGTGLLVPSALEIREFQDSLGSRVLDFSQPESSQPGDGVFRSEELRQGFYRFELSRHLFNILNGGYNGELAVVPTLRTSSARRAILEGGNSANPEQRVELTVYYTKTNN